MAEPCIHVAHDPDLAAWRAEDRQSVCARCWLDGVATLLDDDGPHDTTEVPF